MRLPFLLAISGCLLSLPAAAEERPNVVFILADDQAFTDYGFMGHKTIQTPHLDALAKESLVYTRGYVPTSLCRASLMTLVTGLYPHEHGVTGNDPPQGIDRSQMLKFVRQTPTLPRVLKEAGYRTFQSGKWWEGSYQDGGFTHGMTHGDPKRGGRHGDLGLKIGREGLQPIFDFIESRGEQPFFVWYAPMLPHQPHNPPEWILKKYRDRVDSLHVAKYYAMCEWWDETCGQLLSYLDQQKLRDNTLVVYVCDNGWIQQPNKAAFDPRSKRSPYEPGIRTPILFRWPGHIKPLVDDEHAVSTIHLAPTIANACQAKGLKFAERGPLSSLLDRSTLEGEAAPVFGEIFAHDVADIDRPAASLQSRWIHHGDRKLIASTGGAMELYDVGADPGETKNLAQAEPQRVQELLGRLDRWWQPASIMDGSR